MRTSRQSPRLSWATPAVGILIGLVYLVGFSLGGRPLDGIISFAIMVAFTGAIVLLARRSETVRGLIDHRDERITGIDLRATAVTALAMIVAVLVGFTIEVARGHSGAPYYIIGAVGGLAYVGAVGYYRIRA